MNKNSRQRKVQLRKAVTGNNRSVVFERNKELSGYYDTGCNYRNIEITVPTELSESSRRNMQQRVLKNSNGDGQHSSLTVHEPIHSDRPVKHKNHGYLQGQYTQPKGIRV